MAHLLLHSNFLLYCSNHLRLKPISVQQVLILVDDWADVGNVDTYEVGVVNQRLHRQVLLGLLLFLGRCILRVLEEFAVVLTLCALKLSLISLIPHIEVFLTCHLR